YGCRCRDEAAPGSATCTRTVNAPPVSAPPALRVRTSPSSKSLRPSSRPSQRNPGSPATAQPYWSRAADDASTGTSCGARGEASRHFEPGGVRCYLGPPRLLDLRRSRGDTSGWYFRRGESGIRARDSSRRRRGPVSLVELDIGSDVNYRPASCSAAKRGAVMRLRGRLLRVVPATALVVMLAGTSAAAVSAADHGGGAHFSVTAKFKATV